jgi:two-component system, OmpR family, phosphate regulon response regulator OmpR
MTNAPSLPASAPAAAPTAPRHRILVVDDDLRLRDLLKRYLTEQGFAADTVPDGQAMNHAFTRNRYDLVVLDVMLPVEDGFAICQRVRTSGAAEANIPIIMLTAKGDDADRIQGLDIGADDYLAKPFNPRELVARINAVLRRQAPLPTPGAPSENDELVHFGPFVLNLGTRELTKDGAAVPMTTGEFGLLKVLAQHQRTPLSRDKLTELARGREHDTFDRAIDVQVSRLRKLLGEDPSNPRYIQTVWGRGYVFVPDGGKAENKATTTDTGSKASHKQSHD